MKNDFEPRFDPVRARWEICYRLPGALPGDPPVRRRRFAQSKAAAREIQNELLRKFSHFGTDGLTIDPRDWARFQVLLDRAGGWAALEGLVSAAEDRPGRRQVGSIALAEAVEEYLDRKEAGRSISKAWWKDLERKLRGFAAGHAGARCEGITPERIEAHLGHIENPASRSNVFRILRAFFRDLERREVIARSPVRAVAAPRVPSKEPGIVTAAQARRIFAVMGANPAWWDLLPWVALRAFAGLRTKQLERVTWEMIRVDRRALDLPAGVLRKSRKRAWLEGHPPNLWEWIEPLAQASGPLIPSNWAEHRLAALLKDLRIPYPRNGWRHGFATHHLAAHQNAELTRRLMTHAESSSTLENMYEGYATPEEGRAWEAIVPPWIERAW